MICTKQVKGDQEMVLWIKYLGDHFKPCVYFDCAEPAGDCMTYFVLCPEIEPKSKESEGIL
jgi:hypothetical protein